MRKTLFSNLIKLSVAFVAVVSMTESAQAISLRFKSKVFSSGPIIYACNAGVGSAQPSGRVCYFDGNPAKGLCTPLQCDKAKENCDTSCVCTGTNGGAYLPAILKARTQSLDVDGNPTGAISSPIRVTSTGNVFQKLLTDANAWNNKISDVGTYFAQELYTGKYFVDVCYKSTNIPDMGGNYTISTQASAIPFAVTNPVGFNSLDNNRTGLDFDNVNNALGLNYVTKSGLTVQTFVACNTGSALPEFSVNADGVPTGGINATSYSASTASPMSASALTFSHGSLIDPMSCKVRYVFTETDYKKVNPRFRDHKSEGAELCTYTVIEDPIATPVAP